MIAKLHSGFVRRLPPPRGGVLSLPGNRLEHGGEAATAAAAAERHQGEECKMEDEDAVGGAPHATVAAHEAVGQHSCAVYELILRGECELLRAPHLDDAVDEPGKGEDGVGKGHHEPRPDHDSMRRERHTNVAEGLLLRLDVPLHLNEDRHERLIEGVRKEEIKNESEERVKCANQEPVWHIRGAHSIMAATVRMRFEATRPQRKAWCGNTREDDGSFTHFK